MTLIRRITKGGRWRAALLLVLHLLVPGVGALHGAGAELAERGVFLSDTGEAPAPGGHAEHSCPLCRVTNEPQHLAESLLLFSEGPPAYADLGAPRSAAPVQPALLSPDRAPRAPPALS